MWADQMPHRVIAPSPVRSSQAGTSRPKRSLGNLVKGDPDQLDGHVVPIVRARRHHASPLSSARRVGRGKQREPRAVDAERTAQRAARGQHLAPHRNPVAASATTAMVTVSGRGDIARLSYRTRSVSAKRSGHRTRGW